MFMRPGPTQKLILASFLSIFAVGISGYVFWWINQYIRNSQFIFSSLESQISTLEEERKAARRASSLLEERSIDIDRIDRLLVERTRPVDFIETLEGLAKRTKNNLALDFDEGQSSADTMIFRLTVEGTEPQVRKYLLLVELLPHKISIIDLNWQRVGTGEAIRVAPGKKPAEEKATHRLAFTVAIKAR